MKCSDAMQKFMELDDYRMMPAGLRLHLLLCRKCRRECAELQKVFLSLTSSAPYKAPLNIVSSVMSVIFANESYVERRVSGLKWVAAGSVIFSSIFLINFSETFIMLREHFGSFFIIPMSIVLGLVITAYAVILIGCNYEYIKKYIEQIHITRH